MYLGMGLPLVGGSGDMSRGFEGLADPAFPTLAGGWTPEVHYKAHKLSGEGLLASWVDSSASGGHTLLQAVEPNQPTVVTEIVGGYPVVRFDGVDNFMFNDSLTGMSAGSSKELWTFAVVVPRGWTANDTFWSMDGGTAASRCGVRQIGSTPNVEGFRSVGGTDVALTLNTPHLIVHKMEFAQAYLKLDGGAAQANQNQGSDSTMEDFYMGSDPTPGNYAQVDIAEYILIDVTSASDLVDADRLLVETYLDDKYSLGFIA